MREKLHAIIVVGIVGSRDDYAGLKIILANQAGNSRRGDDTGKFRAGSGLLQTRGKQRGDMRARFARIHADEGVGGAEVVLQISAQSAPNGVERLIVERRRAGNATNTVGAKKFFSHN